MYEQAITSFELVTGLIIRQTTCPMSLVNLINELGNPYWNGWRRFSNNPTWMCRAFWMRIPTQRLPDSRKQWSSHTHTKPLTLKTDFSWRPLSSPPLAVLDFWEWQTVNVSHLKSARGCQVQHALFGGLRPCVQREASYWSNVLLWRWMYTRLGWSKAGPTATMLALCQERSLTAGVSYFRRDESVHCLLANAVHALVEVWQMLITDFCNSVFIYFHNRLHQMLSTEVRLWSALQKIKEQTIPNPRVAEIVALACHTPKSRSIASAWALFHADIHTWKNQIKISKFNLKTQQTELMIMTFMVI